MKLAVSQLAWNKIEEIKDYNISLIECVFSKIKDINIITDNDITQWCDRLLHESIKPYAVQSINYGSCINAFKYDEENKNYYKKIIELAKIAKLKRIIFGSPTLRRGSVDQSVVDILKYIDSLLEDTDIIWCIEPNAKIYGGMYFHTIEDIVTFLEKHCFKNIKTMLDTHNGILECRDNIVDIKMFNSYITHIHVSEENLAPLHNLDYHKQFATFLKQCNYNHIVTYECKSLTNIQSFIDIYY